MWRRTNCRQPFSTATSNGHEDYGTGGQIRAAVCAERTQSFPATFCADQGKAGKGKAMAGYTKKDVAGNTLRPHKKRMVLVAAICHLVLEKSRNRKSPRHLERHERQKAREIEIEKAAAPCLLLLACYLLIPTYLAACLLACAWLASYLSFHFFPAITANRLNRRHHGEVIGTTGKDIIYKYIHWHWLPYEASRTIDF